MEHITAIRKLKESLLRHYGADLESMQVFGSVARNTSGPMSDIDVMVILNRPSKAITWRTEREITTNLGFVDWTQVFNVVDKLFTK
jgi:predicted nucleotidyltransferase